MNRNNHTIYRCSECGLAYERKEIAEKCRAWCKEHKSRVSALSNMPSKKMETHLHDKLDFNYIVDGIYIGTNQCCQTHFNEKLTAEGISADISL